MLWELCYTSAARGLRPGSTGFCTVAATAGLPEVLAGKLEMLSGYKELFPAHDPRFGRNPVLYSHVRLTTPGRAYHVVSRVAAAPPDYTGRSNKFAHHVALEEAELPPGGPAALMAQPGLLQAAWDGQVRALPARPGLPRGEAAPADCHHWREVTGDPSWAAALAADFLKDPSRPVYLLYPVGIDLLPLLAEALALLPAERRWEVTFSTFHRAAPAGIFCAWRGLPREAPEAAELLRQTGVRVLRLGRAMGPAPANAVAEMARAGRAAATVPPAPPRDIPLPEPSWPPTVVPQDGSVRRSSSGPLVAATPTSFRAALPPPAKSGGRVLLLVAGVIVGIMVAGSAGVGLWQIPSMRAALVTSSGEYRQLEADVRARAAEMEQKLEEQKKELAEKGTELGALKKKLKEAHDAIAQAAGKQKAMEKDLQESARDKLRAEQKAKDELVKGRQRTQREREAYAIIWFLLGTKPEDVMAADEQERNTLLRAAWSDANRKEQNLIKELQEVEKNLSTCKQQLGTWAPTADKKPGEIRAYFLSYPKHVKDFTDEQTDRPNAFNVWDKKLNDLLERSRSIDNFERIKADQKQLDALRKEWDRIARKLAPNLPEPGSR